MTGQFGCGVLMWALMSYHWSRVNFTLYWSRQIRSTRP